MLWVAIQSDGQKLLVKCPNKLNVVGFWNFENLRRKNAFPGHVFLAR